MGQVSVQGIRPVFLIALVICYPCIRSTLLPIYPVRTRGGAFPLAFPLPRITPCPPGTRDAGIDEIRHDTPNAPSPRAIASARLADIATSIAWSPSSSHARRSARNRGERNARRARCRRARSFGPAVSRWRQNHRSSSATCVCKALASSSRMARRYSPEHSSRAGGSSSRMDHFGRARSNSACRRRNARKSCGVRSSSR